MSIIYKTEEEIAKMKQGGKILANVLNRVASAVKPGVTTQSLNDLAEELLKKYSAEPAFLNYLPDGEKVPPYPASLCVSINEEVVHGTPSDRRLSEGDIIGLDLGVKYLGYYSDKSLTVGVGKISKEAEKLIKVTKDVLDLAIENVKPRIKTGDLGFLIENYVKKFGFSVVRDLVGHGVGRKVHEGPAIPNFGQRGKGVQFKEGMTFAIEPMVNIGGGAVTKKKDDLWTIVTLDGSLSAHFEDTVAVTKEGCLVLTR